MATTARTITAHVRKTLREAGLLDSVVKVNTRESRTSALGGIRDTWTTVVETVTKEDAKTVTEALATKYPHVTPSCGMNFFTAHVIQPRDEAAPAPAAEQTAPKSDTVDPGTRAIVAALSEPKRAVQKAALFTALEKTDGYRNGLVPCTSATFNASTAKALTKLGLFEQRGTMAARSSYRFRPTELGRRVAALLTATEPSTPPAEQTPESVETKAKAVAAELAKPTRARQRAALLTMVQESARGWRDNVVPAPIIAGRNATGVVGALERLGTAEKRTTPHVGFVLTELGRQVAALLTTTGSPTPDAVEQVAALIAPSIVAEQEAAERVEETRPLLALATRPLPDVAEWNNGLPGSEAKVGDTVVFRVAYPGVLNYGRVAEVGSGPDARLTIAWISPDSLKRWAGRVRPEVFADDYAEMMAQDARHRVIAAWVLAERLDKLTDAERADAEELRDHLGELVGRDTNPVWFVRSTLADHARSVAAYGTREAHAQAAHDRAYRVALAEHRLVRAFPYYPQVIHVPVHRTGVDPSGVRVVATATP